MDAGNGGMAPVDAEIKPPPNVLLAGINGSTAYGLATEDSDVDRIGCYAAPTAAFHGLHLPVGKGATWVSTKPDATYHEAGKLAALLLKCNPTVAELLWLDRYETAKREGWLLMEIRRSFLSAKAVRSAYLGYATQQLKKMEEKLAREDMHSLPHGEACNRVRPEQPVSGRVAEDMRQLRERAGEGALLAQAGAVPGGQGGAQPDHAIRSAREPGTTPAPELRDHARGLRHVPQVPGWGVQDLRRAGNGGGSRSLIGTLSGDSVPALQPGPGSLQGRPRTTAEGDRLPARMRTDGGRCRRCQVEKHARHLWRLIHQGTELHVSGQLSVRLGLAQAAACREFGEDVAARGVDVARDVLARAEETFDKPGVLPDRPDEAAAEAWLQDVRRAYWDRA